MFVCLAERTHPSVIVSGIYKYPHGFMLFLQILITYGDRVINNCVTGQNAFFEIALTLLNIYLIKDDLVGIFLAIVLMILKPKSYATALFNNFKKLSYVKN